jgi:hypothetical protein
MDTTEIQILIDRLEALKRRHAELIDEQIELTKKVAESVVRNEQSREYLAIELDVAQRDRETRKQARRSGG